MHPVFYPAIMKWGAVVIVSDNHRQINIAKKTKTGNCNDDNMAYIGRYMRFWSRQMPTNLLLNNNPVLSNHLCCRPACMYWLLLLQEEP